MSRLLDRAVALVCLAAAAMMLWQWRDPLIVAAINLGR